MKITTRLLSLSLFLFPSFAFALDGQEVLRAVDRFGDQALTRAEVLAWSVEYLYGGISGDVVPTTYDETVFSIADSLGALRIWGQDARESLGNGTTRCQTLEVVFALAQVEPPASSKADFTDARTQKIACAVGQALSWDLLAPLQEKSFGCNRAIKASELAAILGGIGQHVNLPLVAPEEGVSPATTREPATSAVRRREVRDQALRREKKDTSTKLDKVQQVRKPATITVESAIDRGSRISKSSLPEEEMLTTIWRLVGSKYLHIDTVDQQELGYEIAEIIMKKLGDPYTTFFRPSSAESFQKHLQGEVTGIGAQVESHPGGGLMVVTPINGSPAMSAGMQPGDHITEVDGKSILTLNLQEAVDHIRGPVGTQVEITIERNGARLVLKITRAKIDIPEIEVSQQDGIAVVKLIQFGKKSMEDLEGELVKALEQRPVGIILDLRHNPGGYLDAAVDVLGHFLPVGTVVTKIKTASSLSEERTSRAIQIVPKDMPVVVLVNKGSASASEIVAGALQDLGRATIIGTQTFGKGTVQEVFQPDNGSWSIKYTIAEWLTPLGRNIEKQGVTPDIVVGDPVVVGGRDEVMLKAIQIMKDKAR